jgi:hypothetical protein
VRPLAHTSSAQEHGEVEAYPVGKYGHTRIRDLTKYLGSAYKTSHAQSTTGVRRAR